MGELGTAVKNDQTQSSKRILQSLLCSSEVEDVNKRCGDSHSLVLCMELQRTMQ